MKILIYILLSLISFQGIAQKYANKAYYLVDSLNLSDLEKEDKELIAHSLKLFFTAKDDTSKVNAINSISENMQHDDWIKYLKFQIGYIEKSLKRNNSEKIRYKLKSTLANSYNFYGFYFKDLDDFMSAIKQYNLALEISEEIQNNELISQTNYNLGFIYTIQGDYAKAIEYCTKSLIVSEQIGSKDGINSSLGQIGIIYKKQGDYDKALEFYFKSLAIDKEIGDEEGLSTRLNNIAVIYGKQKKYDKAMEFYQKSLEIDEKRGDNGEIASALNNIGVLYKLQGQYVKAINYFLKSLKIREQIKDNVAIANSNLNLGEMYRLIKQYNKSIEYSKRSLIISQKLGALENSFHAAKQLYEDYKSINKYSEALEMHELFVQLRDSNLNENNQKEMINQQYKYEYSKQHLADSLGFIKEKELKEVEHKVELNKEQNQRYLLYGGIIFLLILGGMALNGFQRKMKANKLILAQKTEVELQKTLVEEKNQEIMDSIVYAKRIQNAILPPIKLVKEYLKDSFILYKPKDIVAGDFYWMEQKDGKVLFAAADCTGHGVPGAMVSVVCNNAMNRSVREYGLTEPEEILNKTREIVIQEFEKSEDEVKDGMDIALCSLEGNTLKYAGANNPLWIIRKGNEEIDEIKADKQPIGKCFNPNAFKTHIIELQKGDSFYIFSDGYADQFGGEMGKKFKAANFKKLILSVQKYPIEKQRELINEAFENWKGELEQLDDVCVIGVKMV